MKIHIFVTVALMLLPAAARSAAAQAVETVGSRALGMGGAFVAVASDSSATWWNPAGLADGPFIDLSLTRAVTDARGSVPEARRRATSFAIAAPMFGFSYYRLRLTDIRPSASTAGGDDDREEGTAGVALRSVAVSQVGPTILQTLFQGIHAGTTLKYVRGTVRTGVGGTNVSAEDQFERGETLEGGDSEGHFDLDVGVLVTAGPVRLGGVMRNVREPEFDNGLQLPRQTRLGAAFDVEKAGGPALLLSVDADARAYDTTAGTRRVVAVGGEQWLLARRVGIRAGARFNQVGAEDRSATVGVSVAPRAGMFVEGHVVRGGSVEERGWGAAVRVSF